VHVEHRRPPRPLVEGPGGDDRMIAGARRLREGTDRAIIGLFGGNLMENGQFLYRNDNFLALLAAEPERAHDLLERLTERHLKNLEKYLGLVGPYIDIILFGDDLGMQTGPRSRPACTASSSNPATGACGNGPRSWRRQGDAPLLRRRTTVVGRPHRRRPGLHQPGPDQLQRDGRDGAEARFRPGHNLLGRWLRHAVAAGSRDPRCHPRARPSPGGHNEPGGGFVFQQVHNVLADVPAENIVAMLDAVGGHVARPSWPGKNPTKFRLSVGLSAYRCFVFGQLYRLFG